jgi:hypothetical protein
MIASGNDGMALFPPTAAPTQRERMETRILQAVMLVVLLCTGSSAYAEWELMIDDTDHKIKVYSDPSTIRYKGNIVKLWQLYDHHLAQRDAAGNHYASARIQEEFDCVEEISRMLVVH